MSAGNIHSFGRYHYANNNPYKYIDPDGREVIISADLQPTVDNLVGKSNTAKSILSKLDADPRKFLISGGNDPSGGDAKPFDGKPAGVFERTFLGKEDEPGGMQIKINLDPNSHTGFIKENGGEFTSSAERILGHELGHAEIFADGGRRILSLNQAGAVDTENKIAKELDSNSPVRHRTKGHGSNLTNF